jgi:hypothetical protein
MSVNASSIFKNSAFYLLSRSTIWVYGACYFILLIILFSSWLPELAVQSLVELLHLFFRLTLILFVIYDYRTLTLSLFSTVKKASYLFLHVWWLLVLILTAHFLYEFSLQGNIGISDQQGLALIIVSMLLSVVQRTILFCGTSSMVDGYYMPYEIIRSSMKVLKKWWLQLGQLLFFWGIATIFIAISIGFIAFLINIGLESLAVDATIARDMAYRVFMPAATSTFTQMLIGVVQAFFYLAHTSSSSHQ